ARTTHLQRLRPGTDRLTLGSPISFIIRSTVFSAESHMSFPRSYLLAAAALTALAGTPAYADVGIQVVMNQAKIVKLARPADTIVVGNPAIADAAVQDASTIVL